MLANLELDVKPDWESINDVREKSLTFLAQKAVEGDIAHAIAMIACELAENATKYGAFEESAHGTFHVQLLINGEHITVEVKSPVTPAQEENLIRLDRMVQWIRGYQDPFQAYVERLKEVSAQSLYCEESGLGLVRIAYEGQSVIDFYVDDTNTLAVSAVFEL